LLDSGTIVAGSGRVPEARFRMDAEPGQLLEGIDLVVLVNRGSASAAEILARALRDNNRAQLVGQRTYGKGSVQSVIPFSDGRALKLTTSRYVTPGGAPIDARGIEPDWPLETAADVAAEPRRDPEVGFALQLLQGKAAPLPPRRTATTAAKRG
jgi:carboxyl-terminal processing protease